MKYLSIRKQLIAMARRDQKMRSSKNWDTTIDRANTIQLKRIIQKVGWPTISLVGKDASHAAWLIAQHADHDLKFQQSCFVLLLKASKLKDVDRAEVAYLQDRILVKQNRKQIYGTQFYFNKNKKKLFAYPVDDKKNLNKRRQSLGLEPFYIYFDRMSQKNK